MPPRPQKSSVVVPSNQDIALEIVKAALAGGALQRRPVPVDIIQGRPDEANKLTAEYARLDASYAVRLYQGVLTRLEVQASK